MPDSIEFRVAFVDASSGEYQVETVRGLGVVDVGLEIHYRLESWRGSTLSPGNPLVIGVGPFSGSPLFGSNRLVAVFRSPQTRGLHVSAMGGAGVEFRATGVDAVAVVGRAEEPSILVVEGDGSGLRGVRLEELGWARLWSIWKGYRGLRGVWALTRYLLDTVEISGRARSIVVGPAAARTVFAGLFSVETQGWKTLSPVVDSAARAGGGSVMLQAHGIAAIVFGGTYDRCTRSRLLCDRGVYEEAARRVLGRRYYEAVLAAGRKYRFDESLGTGGTFGVNYVHYRDLIPMMGYNTVYLSKPARRRLVELVLEHLWRPVQRDVFESKVKPWRTCGEPCPLACKKVWRDTKVDYEPSNALGPMIGVFQAEQMAELVKLVDELGLDAIEAGHIVSWLFDLLHRGMLSPGELGVSGRPRFDPLTIRAEDSAVNAKLAREILEGLVEHRTPVLEAIARMGARAAAALLEREHPERLRMYGLKFRDLLVYSAYGSEGYMTPNLYWAPGMVAPIPVPGRYWTVYTPTFMEPEEMAETAAERAIAEYLVDNAGFCRFHRKWLERLLEELYAKVYGVETSLRRHAARILLRIAEYQEKAGAEPGPWESRKTVDMVASIAEEVGDTEWASRIVEGGGAREWWNRFKARFYSKLEEAAQGQPHG